MSYRPTGIEYLSFNVDAWERPSGLAVNAFVIVGPGRSTFGAHSEIL